MQQTKLVGREKLAPMSERVQASHDLQLRRRVINTEEKQDTDKISTFAERRKRQEWHEHLPTVQAKVAEK